MADYNTFAPTLARPELIAPPIDLDAAGDELPLLAHEGEPIAPTTFKDEYGGWANDYFINLSPAGAAWPITISRKRTYTATIRYHLAGEEARPLVLRTGKRQDTVVQLPPALSEALPVADRVKRKEVYPRRWAEFTVEGLRIPAGSQELRISTPEADTGLWVKEVRLTNVK